MKRTHFLLFFSSLLIYILFLQLIDRSSPAIPTAEATQQLTPAATSETSPSPLTCANPAPSVLASCQAIEQQILDATVRFLMVTPLMYVEGSGMRILNGSGHGTVKDGRYLVTHNHLETAFFSLLQQGDPENLITIYLFNASGELILQEPGQIATVALIERQTVVLDFGEGNGGGYFAAHGFPSATFAANNFDLQPGMEVAQVDWDGVSSHVNWVTVEEVTTVSYVPIAKLAGCVQKGASGGGVFWRGRHIGNNWSRSHTCSQVAQTGSEGHSSVALNRYQTTDFRLQTSE